MTAPFSSRGYTTWEIREGTGAGRVKPDLVANARYVLGNTPLICARGKPCVIKCVKHWGNRYASSHHDIVQLSATFYSLLTFR